MTTKEELQNITQITMIENKSLIETIKDYFNSMSNTILNTNIKNTANVERKHERALFTNAQLIKIIKAINQGLITY